MLYTIGHTKSYNKGLDEHEKLGKPLLKAGRVADYIGGIVFLTEQEARDYLVSTGFEKQYSVYGLQAELEDTYMLEGNRHLTKNVPIVKL